MGEHGDAGVALTQAPDVRRCEPLMHLAMPLPGDDLNGGQRRGITRQILVRQHDDARHQPDIGCRDRGRKGVPGLEIGDQHDLAGVQEPGGLGHEMDARQHDGIGLDTRGLACER